MLVYSQKVHVRALLGVYPTFIRQYHLSQYRLLNELLTRHSLCSKFRLLHSTPTQLLTLFAVRLHSQRVEATSCTLALVIDQGTRLPDMAQFTPTRRALVDLPVNTFSTPSSMNSVGKASMGHKRQIQEVEEPEFAQPTSRVRVSPARSQSTLKDDALLGQVTHASSWLS